LNLWLESSIWVACGKYIFRLSPQNMLREDFFITGCVVRLITFIINNNTKVKETGKRGKM
jgi:hypothetical protein